MIGKGKLSNAMKDALIVYYLREAGDARIPHPEVKTVMALIKKNMLTVDGTVDPIIWLTPFGRNIAKMILGEPL